MAIATTRGMGRVLVDNPRCKYILDPFPGGGGVLAATFITKKPAEARSLLAAFDEAIASIRLDETSAKAILPKYAPVDADIAAKSQLYAWWTSSQIDLKSLQDYTNLLESDGIVKGHVDVRTIVVKNDARP